MPSLRRQFLSDRRAMTAWEYGLIAAIICLGIIGSLTLLGTSTLHGFTVVSSTVAATNSGR